MDKSKAKTVVAVSEPGSDTKALYSNYLQSCKIIGVQPSPSLKLILTNEQNPNRGVQMIIIGEGNDVLGPDGCRAFINAMIGKVDTLTTSCPFTGTKDLRIVRSSINDAGAIAVSRLLMATAGTHKTLGTTSQPEWKLEYLELRDNDIGRDGAMALGRSLSVGMNKTLVALIMDFNKTLGSAGVTALCKGLSTNSTLKKLSLKYCDIDENGGTPISKMLMFPRLALISLDLTSNRIGGMGLASICDGLKENSTLKTLRLGDNSIGQSDRDREGLEIFSNVLSLSCSLSSVNFLHNKIGSVGGSILLKGLKDNQQITEFLIDSTDMNEDIYNELLRFSKTSNANKGESDDLKKKKVALINDVNHDIH